MKAIFEYLAKSKNRRINITLVRDVEPFFIVETKRLIDFKDRKITTTKSAYSVETMMLLTDLFKSFLDEATVKKEINPFTKFDRWECKCVKIKQD